MYLKYYCEPISYCSLFFVLESRFVSPLPITIRVTLRVTNDVISLRYSPFDIIVDYSMQIGIFELDT
jgi:hypothetical protein